MTMEKHSACPLGQKLGMGGRGQGGQEQVSGGRASPVDHVIQLGEVCVGEGRLLVLQLRGTISLARFVRRAHRGVLVRGGGRGRLENTVHAGGREPGGAPLPHSAHRQIPSPSVWDTVRYTHMGMGFGPNSLTREHTGDRQHIACSLCQTACTYSDMYLCLKYSLTV